LKYVQRYKKIQDLRKTPLLPEVLDLSVKTSLVKSTLVNIHLEEIDRSATAAADLRDVGAGVEGN
jgi:hypothetical protein